MTSVGRPRRPLPSGVTRLTLVEAYKRGAAVTMIAARFNVTYAIVRRELRAAELDLSAAYTLRRTRQIRITPRLREVLWGVLLSDGCVTHKAGRRTAAVVMQQHPKGREWLDLILTELRLSGGDGVVTLLRPRAGNFYGRKTPERRYLMLRTYNYADFTGLRRMWYLRGKKRVPNDLVLTPRMVAHWFAGDGHGTKGRRELGIATNGFTARDTRRLCSLLQRDLGVRALVNGTGRPGQFRIAINRGADVSKFKDAIAPYMPGCYMYKLASVTGARRPNDMRLPAALKTMALSLPDTLNDKQKATIVGVSVTTIRRWRGVWRKLL